MPWKETSAMDQRIRLIADWLSGDYRKKRAVPNLRDQSTDRR